MILLDIDEMFNESQPILQAVGGSRGVFESFRCHSIQDSCEEARCLLLRTTVQSRARFSGIAEVLRCAAGGWLLRGRAQEKPAYWLPMPPTLRRVNLQGHILEERKAELVGVELGSTGTTIAFSAIPEGWSLDAVIWRLDDAALVDELRKLTPIETQGYFLLGSHTRYGQDADLYRLLIHGWVYEDRYAWPHKRRICSENDAHALHLIFSGLRLATGKRLYGFSKTQLLLSVLSRQGNDGGFRHGEWTDHVESHYRLHCSAMHMMLDALSEADDPIVRWTLLQAASFISNKRDTTEVGAWFYHDELELTAAGTNSAPFRCLPGKSPHNLLVPNTHLDILIVLDRYRQLTGDDEFSALVQSGLKSTQAVLSLKSAEWLYRLLFSAINLTLLPTVQAKRLPIWKRLWKRIGWQVFIPHLYQIKNVFPRLVMPGGYIDRHLALASWAFHYLTVKVMDLARARRRFGGEVFDSVLQEAANFAQKSGVRERWKRLKYERYALGFWVEALWHLSRESPNHLGYDDWYREAFADLESFGMGLPPSHLGGNAEVATTG